MPSTAASRWRSARQGPRFANMLSPAAPTSPLRILVVDADRRVRDSLRELIRCEVGLETVAAVGTADEAREAAAAAEPDVIVIDPRLPEVEAGIALIDELRSEHPSTRLL